MEGETHFLANVNSSLESELLPVFVFHSVKKDNEGLVSI